MFYLSPFSCCSLNNGKVDAKSLGDTTHRPTRASFSHMSLRAQLKPTLLDFDLARCRTLRDLIEPKLWRPARRALVLVIQGGPSLGTFRKYISTIFADIVSWAPVVFWLTEKEKLGCRCRRSWWWYARNGGEGRSYLRQHKLANANRKDKEYDVRLHCFISTRLSNELYIRQRLIL